MIFDLIFQDENICLFCGENIQDKFFLCDDCISKLDYVDNEFYILSYKARALYFYNDFMAKLIADYKLNRNTSLYKIFGSMIYEYIRQKNLLDFDYLLCTPSSKSVLNKRGFDHIRLICNYFIKETKMTYLNSFKKIKNTKPQHSLSKTDRSKNLKDSFAIDIDLSGKAVLIFDDIITSSSTCKEIIRTLEKKNPKKIEILALSSSHKVK